jgi:3',5'-cyclic AMP phosphodiesterase CpdA
MDQEEFCMTEFRLTQISDTHLARRLQKLTDNFHRVSEHIDATRPDLVINSGDLAFDAPTSRDDLKFAQRAARCAAGAVPSSARQSRHRRQPDGSRSRAEATGDREGAAELSRT